MNADYVFFLSLFVVICVTMITLGCTLLGVINAQQRRNSEREFKEKLLDRGMSADEIIKLVEASPMPTDGFERWLANLGKK